MAETLSLKELKAENEAAELEKPEVKEPVQDEYIEVDPETEEPITPEAVEGEPSEEETKDVEVSTAKRGLLRELLSDLSEPVVIFCRFIYDLKTIKGICAELDREYFELSGRAKQIPEWNE